MIHLSRFSRIRRRRAFLPRLFLTSLLGIATVAGFNYLMNPFGIWSDLFFRPINPQLTTRINSVRLVKAYDLLRRPGSRPGTQIPTALVTGMSTVAWGMDPVLHPIPTEVLYNGGLPGSTIEEQYHYVRTWLDQAPTIRKVYLDLNLSAFVQANSFAADFRHERMQLRIPTMTDIAFTCMTRYALAASLNTWRLNYLQRIQFMLRDAGDGYHRRQTSAPIAYQRNMTNIITQSSLRNLRYPRSLDPAQLHHLRRIADLCRSRGVELILFFGPEHAWMQEQDRLTGSLPQRLALRRQVLQIQPFWDFELCSLPLTEPAHAISQFIDPIHYRPELGAAVLATINARRPPQYPESFGVLVTPRTIDAHLDRLQCGLRQWAEDHPAEATSIRDIVDRHCRELEDTCSLDDSSTNESAP